MSGAPVIGRVMSLRRALGTIIAQSVPVPARGNYSLFISVLGDFRIFLRPETSSLTSLSRAHNAQEMCM
jgi:hypothetical protein